MDYSVKQPRATDTKIIIDHGTFYTKYGYAGYNKPHNKIRSKIYKHKLTQQLYMHADIIKNNIPLKDLIPLPVIQNSVIIDFTHITLLWDTIFQDLKANTANCELLIADPIFISHDYHDNIQKIMYNKYKFKKIEFCNQQLLGLYGSCSDKGIVIDLGHDGTRIVPIFDSYILIEGIVLFSICRNLYNKVLQKTQDPSFQNMLLNPHEFGIDDFNLADALIKSIKECPIDLRKKLCQNIIIIGGGSMGTLLTKKLKNIVEAEFESLEICITCPMNRNVITWLGGSMLCVIQ